VHEDSPLLGKPPKVIIQDIENLSQSHGNDERFGVVISKVAKVFEKYEKERFLRYEG